MGQISMEIIRLPGSVLSGNQHFMPRSWGEPANAIGPRERANAVANDFFSRKLKPRIGK